MKLSIGMYLGRYREKVIVQSMHYRYAMSSIQALRKRWHIICDGEDVPAPIRRFPDMRFPKPIIEALTKKGIKKPTPIQVCRVIVVVGLLFK